MEPTNGIVKELQAENERLQKQLQDARGACDLYENELIKLRDKYDSAKHALWISSGYEKMMLDGSDGTTAPIQPLDNLNIYDDDDTQEIKDIDPVSELIRHETSDQLGHWYTGNNEDES